MTLICVSIKADTQIQTIKKIEKAKTADIIEIRIDYRNEPLNLKALRDTTKIPLIATNRRPDQGGFARETEKERIKILFEASDVGFDYIDIASTTPDIQKTVTYLKKRTSVITSYHDFKTPLTTTELNSIHHELAKLGGDIIKIIGWTKNYSDNLPYLEYNNRYPGNISFGMGIQGIISRVLAPITGAAFTYASLETGKQVAPGQISLNKLRETYQRLKF
jgi:3-dehydroquinate dehydratase type I